MSITSLKDVLAGSVNEGYEVKLRFENGQYYQISFDKGESAPSTIGLFRELIQMMEHDLAKGILNEQTQ